MPTNDTNMPQTSTLALGEGMVIEPNAASAPHSVTEEETSSAQTNEDLETKDTQPAKAVTESEVKESDYLSGSKKARALGESRKKLADVVLKSARTDEASRAELKQMVETDPDLQKYFQKHWAKDYEMLVSGKTLEEVETDFSQKDETAKLKARVELLSEQLKQDKDEKAENLADSLKFTAKEFAELKEVASTLESKFGYDEALKKAAYAVRPDKAKVGLTSLPSGVASPPSPEVQNIAKLEALAEKQSKWMGRKKADVLKNLQTIDKQIDKEGTFHFSMD